MTRSDGRFPLFSKYKLDKDTWPQNYWDINRTCSKCGKSWPHIIHFSPSPCCRANASTMEGPPDMRWPEALAALYEAKFDELYDIWNEGRSDEELAWEEVKTQGQLDDKKVGEEVDKLIDDAQLSPSTRD